MADEDRTDLTVEHAEEVPGVLYGEAETAYCAETETHGLNPWREELGRRVDCVAGIVGPQGKEQSLVSLGCGAGHLLNALIRHVGTLKGIDASPFRVAQAHNVFPILDVECADAMTWEPAERYDWVLLSHVLHEVASWHGVEAAACLVRERLPKIAKRAIIIDHLHPFLTQWGDPELWTTCRFDDIAARKRFGCFAHAMAPNVSFAKPLRGKLDYALSCADLQKYATVYWALGTPAEAMMLRKRHLIIDRLDLRIWDMGDFSTCEPMSVRLKAAGATLLDEDWDRCFVWTGEVK